MKNYLVTVVVPIYNVEKYLPRCLDSIIAQTYKNLEIILVDDGSPDNCGAICDDYKNKDNRIKVIHQENQGLSAARNAGIDIAKGEYICFVDSDDIVANYYVEVLLDSCINNSAEIAIGNYKKFSTNTEFNKSSNNSIKTYNSHEAIKLLLEDNWTKAVVAWNKLYKKSLFDKIKYPVGFIHEDEGTTYKLFYEAKKIVLVDQIIYGYFIRTDSITNTPFSSKRLDYFRLWKIQLKFFKEKNEKELYYLFLYKYKFILLKNFALRYKELKKLNLIKSFYKEYYYNILPLIFSKYILLKKKIKLLIIALCPIKFVISLFYKR